MKRRKARGAGNQPRPSRRSFLKQTAALTGAAIGFPYIIPASALGADGHTAPSNRIVIGCIGVGSMGGANMRNFLRFDDVRIVGVCDVDRTRRDGAKTQVDQRYGDDGCATYHDFRELLTRDDLDAVSIAVPDHWHAIPAIAAAKAGLDIYAEKPLALTIPQGRAMCDAVDRYGRIWQTGSWQRSTGDFRYACELVRNGRIGEVHTVEVGLPTGPCCDPQSEMPVPDGFDYDFWLGPAPEAPYTENRCHFNFRWILDYSGGQVTDWGAHHCDIANWGMGTEGTGPIEVEGKATFPRNGLYNTATDYRFEARFGPGASPLSPNGFTMVMSNAFRMGAKFIGTDGWVQIARGFFDAEPRSLMTSVIGPREVHLYRSRQHQGNFLECMRTRRQTITPIEAAHRAISIAHLGNIAMRLERKIRWDPTAERFVDDPEADRLLSRTMRGSWHL